MKKTKGTLTVTAIIIIAIVFMLASIIFLAKNNQAIQKENNILDDNGTITVCFTPRENCVKEIVSNIKNASEAKAALYDLDEDNIKKALQEKNADILIDEDSFNGVGTKISGPGLMHNKFIILTIENFSKITIAGSANPTKNDYTKNKNNIITITSDVISRNYEEEFSELKRNEANTPTKITKINLSGILVENYFCPEDNCETKVLNTLNNAKSSIYFMTFSFTSNEIGKNIISKNTGLKIRGIFDTTQVKSNKEFSEYPYMISSGLNVKTYGGAGKLHHKVFIIDNNTVITGSYNPTASGDERNDENILIIHDEEIAAAYLEEFERLWAEKNN